MTVGTTFLVIRTLMEKALVKPNRLVTTRITLSFPAKKNPSKVAKKHMSFALDFLPQGRQI